MPTSNAWHGPRRCACCIRARRPALRARFRHRVVLDGRILGKPRDQADARSMLGALSGRAHEVMTAVAIADADRCLSKVVTTRVWFRPLGAGEIDAYWATGEPADKAGAYGIQGLGAVFVERIEGSYSAVAGLPLCETSQMLELFGFHGWRPHD